jgi:hypothetical protein
MKLRFLDLARSTPDLLLKVSGQTPGSPAQESSFPWCMIQKERTSDRASGDQLALCVLDA